MADLSTSEKLLLEKLFGMRTGYVLDFSNRTFQEFVVDSVGIDIYDAKYDYATGSKANRLRAFWTLESPYLVAGLLENLLDYWYTSRLLNDEAIGQTEQELLQQGKSIVQRLREGNPVEAITSIQPPSADENFALLKRAIQETISQDKPELGLDRLHTYTVKYIRHLCDQHSISYDKKTPLHALFGAYVKEMKRQGLVKSEMTERILRSSISSFEAFNDVRNRHSLAHDNPLLSRSEAKLIFNHVANSIQFLQEFEDDLQTSAPRC